MWKKRTPREVVPDDIAQARAIRRETNAELYEARQQAPIVRRLTDGLIDRQGKNHYIELLYQHVPKEAQ